MTTAFYVIKTFQSVFGRRMRTLQFRSPGIAPGNADESAPGARQPGSAPGGSTRWRRSTREAVLRAGLPSGQYHVTENHVTMHVTNNGS